GGYGKTVATRSRTRVIIHLFIIGDHHMSALIHEPAGPNVLATMVTTTTYGTWLPGDLRGYVEDGMILPANPNLLNHAKAMLVKAPVLFTDVQRIVLDAAIRQ